MRWCNPMQSKVTVITPKNWSFSACPKVFYSSCTTAVCQRLQFLNFLNTFSDCLYSVNTHNIQEMYLISVVMDFWRPADFSNLENITLFFFFLFELYFVYLNISNFSIVSFLCLNVFACFIDAQHPTAPPYPCLGPSYVSWMLSALPRTTALLTPITLHAPNFAISSHEEVDADSAACWSRDSGHGPPQAQLASRRGAV